MFHIQETQAHHNYNHLINFRYLSIPKSIHLHPNKFLKIKNKKYIYMEENMIV